MKETEFIRDLVKSEEHFTFELEGKSEIDVAVLTQILDSTVTIINEMVQGEPETYIKLKVTKFSTGSFDIDFQAVAEQVKNILVAPEAVAAYVVAGVGGAFQIAKHLMGKKPQAIVASDNKSEITNSQGDVISVQKKTCDRYFGNAKIEDSIINIINVVGSETDRDGFNVHYPEMGLKQRVEYKKDIFPQIKPVVESCVNESEDKFVNTINTQLIIRKPDLVGGSKWGFVLDRNIDATIEDKEWLEQIRTAKTKFGPGMRLPVSMQVSVDLDKSSNPIKGSERYIVIKVTGDIIEPTELKQISVKMEEDESTK